ncbi:uncharacterized protein BKCO1_3800091 [Diplodia corticola]|uniref:Uncharacterized protein n=1 Tax=Diplodia corticola TaxID=236234 RepID=A0A1J9QVI5_9PEZI|nr:uncharacterized protein BKCO1_3800091 [Diplodia corticola]OJD32401.1 hypothetical protein BKCO1_3800091 [Diplodia corticola]
MGRDVFLTRLVLGRSSHEAPEPAPHHASPPAPGSTSAQYDERGHPANPRARALGRALRDAQNDILAAVGVVERKRVHIAGFPLPPPKDPRVTKQVEAEDLSGTLVAICGTLTRYAGTWWVGALQDRVLTYDYPLELSFSDLVGAQLASAGPAGFLFAGLPAQLISMIMNDGDLWASFVVSLIDDAVFRSSLSRKSRVAISRRKPWIRKLIAISIEVAFAPIVLHAAYQRLFLAPPSQLLPRLQTFNPFSASSPLQAVAVPRPLGMGNVMGWLNALSTSPVVLVIAWRRSMASIQRFMYEPLEKGILTPDNPDQYTADEASERRRFLEKDAADSQQTDHAWSSWFFTCLNWSWRVDSAPGTTGTALHGDGQNTDVHETRGEQRSHTPAEAGGQVRTPGSPSAHTRHASSTSPHSPSESNRNHDDERDATVRIASRDEGSGVVSLEIALPEELQNGVASTRRNHSSETQDNRDEHQQRRSHGPGRGRKRTHRVTQLAEEPAEMLGSWVNLTFSDWVLLPLKAVGLRMIATSCLQSLNPGGGQARLPLFANGILSPSWPAFTKTDIASGPGLTKLGIFAGRVGLCCALQILLGLGLSGVECIAVTVLGKRYFGWGQVR